MQVWLFLTFFLLSFFVSVITCKLRGEQAVYFVLLTWLIFPNWGTNLFGMDGIPVFAFLQIMQSTALVSVICRKRAFVANGDKKSRAISWEDSFFFAFAGFVIVLQLTLGWVANRVLYYGIPVDGFGAYFTNTVCLFTSAVFFIGCRQFIWKVVQIEFMMKLVIWGGMLLVIEFFLTKYVPFLTDILGQFTLLHVGNLETRETSKFISVFLNDAVAVVLWLAISTLFAMYFAFCRGQKKYFIFIMLFLSLEYFNFVRALLLGLLVAGIYVTYMLCYRKSIFYACLLMLLCVVVFVQQREGGDDKGKKVDSYAAARFQQIFSSDSALTRLGQTVRGLQVLGYVFPFGVGPNMGKYYMVLKTPRWWRENDLFIFTRYPMIYPGYKRVTLQQTEAEIQIGYVSFVMSFGFFGLILLTWFLTICLRKAKKALEGYERGSDGWYLAIFFTATLLVYGFFFLFNTTPMIFVIFFFILRVLFLLADKQLSIK